MHNNHNNNDNVDDDVHDDDVYDDEHVDVALMIGSSGSSSWLQVGSAKIMFFSNSRDHEIHDPSFSTNQFLDAKKNMLLVFIEAFPPLFGLVSYKLTP